MPTKKKAKPTHGGPRTGAGRKPRAGEASKVVPVRLSEGELAEIRGNLFPGETVSEVLRDGGLARVRSRPGGRS